jgi:hypothetical protein
MPPFPIVDGPASALDWTAIVRASCILCFLKFLFSGCPSPVSLRLDIVTYQSLNEVINSFVTRDDHVTCTAMASPLRAARCLRVSRPVCPRSRFMSTSRPCRNEADVGVPATQAKPIGAFRGGSVAPSILFCSHPMRRHLQHRRILGWLLPCSFDCCI